MVWIFLFFASLPAEAKEVVLKWTAIAEARQYNVQVASSPEFVSLIFEKETKRTQVVCDLPSGAYFLRVQGVDQIGRMGQWSPPFKIVVTPELMKAAVEELETAPYYGKPKPIQIRWNVKGKANGYRVSVEKDGVVVKTEELKNPDFTFDPEEPGSYSFFISVRLGDHFGKPVLYKKIKWVKNALSRPYWNMGNDSKWPTDKKITLEWKKVEGADRYVVHLNEKLFSDLTDTKVTLDPLPEGRYEAYVEAQIDGDKTISEPYRFEVERIKPWRISHIDFFTRYSFSPSVVYTTHSTSTGKDYSTGPTQGGFALFEGTFWFPSDVFGLRLAGQWGGFTTYGIPVVESEMEGFVLWNIDFIGGNLKPLLGARSWSTPTLIYITFPNHNLPYTYGDPIDIYTSFFLGPAIGLDFQRPIVKSWNLVLKTQISAPVTATNNSSNNQGQPDFVFSERIDLGVKYDFGKNFGLVIAGTYQNNYSQTTPSSNQYNNGYSKNYQQTTATMGTLGLEATDEGRYSKTKSPFSIFYLSARYSLTPTSYNSLVREFAKRSSDLYGLFSGSAELEGIGWFRESHSGLKIVGTWEGFTYSDTNYSFPQYWFQWGYEPKWLGLMTLRNYFGLRAWTVPVIFTDPADNTYAYHPILLGPVETLELSWKIKEGDEIKIKGEVSSPVGATDQNSNVTKIFPDYMSYELGLFFESVLSEDFVLSLGAGYKLDQFRYIPSGFDESQSSLVTMQAPLLSCGFYYIF